MYRIYSLLVTLSYKCIGDLQLQMYWLLAHLSRSNKVSFCDRSVDRPSICRPLTIDLNDNSSLTPRPILK